MELVFRHCNRIKLLSYLFPAQIDGSQRWDLFTRLGSGVDWFFKIFSPFSRVGDLEFCRTVAVRLVAVTLHSGVLENASLGIALRYSRV